VASAILRAVDLVVAVGAAPGQTLRAAGATLGEAPLTAAPAELDPGESLVWPRRAGRALVRVRIAPPRGERRRHRRKYAAGELGPDKSFYFRGPEGKLNLRAQNLA